MTAKASLAQAALRDRREAGLLSLPSVARMAEVLAEQCRETSWVRLAVSTLDRFRAACVGEPQQLEVLLALARDEPETAMSALARFAAWAWACGPYWALPVIRAGACGVCTECGTSQGCS